MRKFTNARIPVIAALMLTAGILLGCILVYEKLNLTIIIAVIPITAIIIILGALFCKSFKVTLFAVIFSLFFTAGAVNCFLRLENLSSDQAVTAETVRITAVVNDKGKNSNGEYIILKNAVVGDIKANGKIIVYLNEIYGDFCDIGYTVSFDGELQKRDLFAYGKLDFYAQRNVKYNCRPKSLITAEYGFSLTGAIRSALRERLYENLDGDTAAVAYAMLTGNTQGIEEEAMSSFRNGGVAHIFAVSGLHIGIVFGILNFLCKKLKLNRYSGAAVCIAPVFLYCAVCGFTLSSVRAAIMCAVSVTARLFRRKYDALNALAVSVTLILLIAPLSLFSSGFRLSVCAVGGIILLSRRIESLLGALPQKLKNAIAVSLSAQIGVMPIMLSSFGYLSAAGLLLNIVFVPILSVLFALMFLASLFSAVIPPAAPFALKYAALPLEAVMSFFINAGLENSVISGFGAGAFVPLYFIVLLVLSDKLNLKKFMRFFAAAVAVNVLCAYALINTYAPFDGFKVTVSAYYGGGEVIIKSNRGNVLIVSDGINPSQTAKTLNDNYVSDLSALIILGGEDCVSAYSGLDLKCDKIYVCNLYLPLQPYNGVTVEYERNFNVCGINFEFADGYSVFAELDGVGIAVCAGDDVPFGECAVLLSDSYGNGCRSEYCAGFNNTLLENNVYARGNLTFSITDGQLKF